jgi:hypothetical protein
MSESQRLRVLGGPIEILQTGTAEVDQTLKGDVPDEGRRALLVARIRKVLAQAVLDSYSIGRKSVEPKEP